MGTLEEHGTQRRYTLGIRCLLGRVPTCDISMEPGYVSNYHASIHWRGDGWELRDLGSLNGTFLDGQRLPSGGKATLTVGQAIMIGKRGATFRLVDASPPMARARNAARQEVREATELLLSLPNDENPTATIFLDLDETGKWLLDTKDFRRPVSDQERITLEEDEWVLELPTASQATLEAEVLTLDAVRMRIGVSRDEEHVFITVEFAGQRHELQPRAYHYLLATLARIRIRESHLPESEQGWVERDTLCKMLATDSNKLNVDIHRNRKQFSTIGIQDAANVIERRQGSGQVRLGVRTVEVYTLS